MAGWAEEEFDAFVAARLMALVRFAFRLTGDVGLAEDLVQTALTSVYVRSRHRKPDAPEAYVRRSIANAFVSDRRRHRVREHLVENIPDSHGQLQDSPLERAAALSALLDGLPAAQRAVLVLRYHEDWSEQQIADALRMPAGTVKSLASRAMATLRARAAAEGSAP